MADTFNGYHVWLGIPASEQPPNHYRFLGIALFETDVDVIDHAADRQMAHVRTFQSGRHQALSQQILNELAAARLCLLTAEKKAAYDEALRAKMGAVPKASPLVVGKHLPLAQPATSAIQMATPVAPPVAKHAAKPAVAARTLSPSKAKTASAVDDVLPLDIDPTDGFASATTATFQVRSKRRASRDSGWQRPAMMGIVAAVVVTGFMMLYFLVHWMSQRDLTEFFNASFLEPPSRATSPSDAPTATTDPPPPLPAASTAEPPNPQP
jgi:hypothetical protein